jgi:hypothetical protein
MKSQRVQRNSLSQSRSAHKQTTQKTTRTSFLVLSSTVHVLCAVQSVMFPYPPEALFVFRALQTRNVKCTAIASYMILTLSFCLSLIFMAARSSHFLCFALHCVACWMRGTQTARTLTLRGERKRQRKRNVFVLLTISANKNSHSSFFLSVRLCLPFFPSSSASFCLLHCIPYLRQCTMIKKTTKQTQPNQRRKGSKETQYMNEGSASFIAMKPEERK